MTTRIKLRRDTAANWAMVNPILALAEPGVETDTNKMKIGDGVKSWSQLQYVDGGDVTRIKAGWIQSVGNIPELANGEGDDFWFESVAVDDDFNSYYVGGTYTDYAPWAVKLDSNGEVVWQSVLGPFDGFMGEGQAVQIDPTNGDVVIIADMYTLGQVGGEGGMMLYRLNPTDGSLVGNPLRIRDDESPNTVDIYPYDLVMDGNDTIIVGVRNDDSVSIETPKLGGSSGQTIVVSVADFPSKNYPTSYDNWYVSGTDINGNGLVTGVNNYNDVNATTITPGDSSGNGAAFNFTFSVYNNVASSSVTFGNNTGSGYAVNDVLTFTAALVGATTDATLTVTSIGGSGEINTFDVTSYVPDITKARLDVDPNGGGVDFSNSGTWNVVEDLNNSAFVRSTQNGGWTSLMGNQDDDWFSVAAIDSNGNVYAGGGTYDANYAGGRSRSMLVKYSNTGVVQYAKSFDMAGSEGLDEYTGLAVDSNDNVYIAGSVWDIDNTNEWFYNITKIDNTGTVIWQKSFNTGDDPFNMWNMCLAVDSDDNVYLASEMNSPNTVNDDFFFAKFSPQGNLIWQRMLKTYGDVNAEWSNGYQSLKVKGDKLFYAASTIVYSNNDNYAALALNLNTDGSGVGVIADGLWELAEANLTWSDTPNQDVNVLNVGSKAATFTTDEPVTGVNATEYTTAYLSVYDGIGGEVGKVRQLTFEDGTVQTTASKPIIPQNIEGTLHGNNGLTLRLDHAGTFIRVNFYNGNQDIYVPTNADVPFEVGTVITIIVDDLYNNNDTVYIYSDGGYRNPEITGVGFSSSNPADWWALNTGSNGSKTGIYTLMKVDTDRWVLAGTDVQEQWC